MPRAPLCSALIQVYNSLPTRTKACLMPSESIYIQQRMYHNFTVEEGTGFVLFGEVSQ